MKYRTGMYGGSFDPLHKGHINCIIRAASQCEELYVVLCFSRVRDSVPAEIRLRWLAGCFRHMDNVRVILLEDNAVSKEEHDTDEQWKRGYDTVIKSIGKPVDVVFCGSDYTGRGRYEALYNCPVVYYDRTEIDISSSEIRENPLRFWDMLPDVCRPYYTKKVLFAGGISTGKSTMVRNLAMVYGTNYLEEVGREVCFNAVSVDNMTEEDYHEILIRHKAEEYKCLKHSRRILFEDTDAVTTLWYAGFLLKEKNQADRVAALADAVSSINSFDLIFFMEPTVPYVQDGIRCTSIAEDREKYSRQIKALLDSHGMKYHCLDGGYEERFDEAKRIINRKFDISEV